MDMMICHIVSALIWTVGCPRALESPHLVDESRYSAVGRGWAHGQQGNNERTKRPQSKDAVKRLPDSKTQNGHRLYHDQDDAPPLELSVACSYLGAAHGAKARIRYNPADRRGTAWVRKSSDGLGMAPYRIPLTLSPSPRSRRQSLLYVLGWWS
jgi:hypothetical protein